MSFDLKIQEGDIIIGSDGDLAKVEDTEKLIQDILKLALTPIGSNRFNPGYGSPISRSLVGSVLKDDIAMPIASNQLKTSLETLQKLQKQQFTYQYVSAAEQLAAIKDVQIIRSTTDPRYFKVFIDVISRELTTHRTGFEITPEISI